MDTATLEYNEPAVGDIVRRLEGNFTRDSVTISKYVTHSAYETICKTEAYLNSTHVSGRYDALGREKPFPNVVVGAANITQRATDIDRNQIKVKPTKSQDTIDAFLATVCLQDYMRRENFGAFLNNWGRVLSRYGSAVPKFVEKEDRLIPSITPWNHFIFDPVQFNPNPKIEYFDYTEADLRDNDNYDQATVDALIQAKQERQTLDKKRKDNNPDFFRVYEVHARWSLALLTHNQSDARTFADLMFHITFLPTKKKGEYEDFTLYAGREKQSPYLLTHLIEEEGRTLSVGTVEHLFQNQWIENHVAKLAKDQLDLAAKIIYQTGDPTFLDQNIHSDLQNGDVLIHAPNMPMTVVAHRADITALLNFRNTWKSLGNEIVGISEAMLGANPPSGSAWRQTEALLQENHSLFDLMTQNKAMHVEQMLRIFIIPFIKRKKLNHSKEIAAILEAHDIDRIDSKYLKTYAIRESNRILMDQMLNSDKMPTPADQQNLMASLADSQKKNLQSMGNTRFFKPSEVSDKTWKKQLEDLEWELDVDIVGESKNYKDSLTTIMTALSIVLNPNYAGNKKAQFLINKALSSSDAISPLELSAIEEPTPPPAPAPDPNAPANPAAPGTPSVPTDNVPVNIAPRMVT